MWLDYGHESQSKRPQLFAIANLPTCAASARKPAAALAASGPSSCFAFFLVQMGSY